MLNKESLYHDIRFGQLDLLKVFFCFLISHTHMAAQSQERPEEFHSKKEMCEQPSANKYDQMLGILFYNSSKSFDYLSGRKFTLKFLQTSAGCSSSQVLAGSGSPPGMGEVSYYHHGTDEEKTMNKYILNIQYQCVFTCRV